METPPNQWAWPPIEGAASAHSSAPVQAAGAGLGDVTPGGVDTPPTEWEGPRTEGVAPAHSHAPEPAAGAGLGEVTPGGVDTPPTEWERGRAEGHMSPRYVPLCPCVSLFCMRGIGAKGF